jgi:hypothetical protein
MLLVKALHLLGRQGCPYVSAGANSTPPTLPREWEAFLIPIILCGNPGIYTWGGARVGRQANPRSTFDNRPPVFYSCAHETDCQPETVADPLSGGCLVPDAKDRAPADYVGARNIRAKALVNVPMVAQPRQLRLALA